MHPALSAGANKVVAEYAGIKGEFQFPRRCQPEHRYPLRPMAADCPQWAAAMPATISPACLEISVVTDP